MFGPLVPALASAKPPAALVPAVLLGLEAKDPFEALIERQARLQKASRTALPLGHNAAVTGRTASPTEQETQVAVLRDLMRRLIGSRRMPERRRDIELLPRRTPGEIARAAFDAAISLTRERFAETGKPKVEIEFSELGVDDARTAIEQFVRAHREGRLIDDPNDQVAQLNLGRIGREHAERLLDEIGIDVSSFHRTIDTKSLSHAFNAHGSGGEKNTRQEPINPEAVALYLDVANDPNSEVEFRKKGRTTAATLTYSKRINGYRVFVEEVRTGRHTLAFKTMWIVRAD